VFNGGPRPRRSSPPVLFTPPFQSLLPAGSFSKRLVEVVLKELHALLARQPGRHDD
jgi:hypothetical protein